MFVSFARESRIDFVAFVRACIRSFICLSYKVTQGRYLPLRLCVAQLQSPRRTVDNAFPAPHLWLKGHLEVAQDVSGELAVEAHVARALWLVTALELSPRLRRTSPQAVLFIETSGIGSNTDIL